MDHYFLGSNISTCIMVNDKLCRTDLQPLFRPNEIHFNHNIGYNLINKPVYSFTSSGIKTL